MSDQKIPSVPAAFCGLFPAAAIRFPHGNVWLVGKVNPFNAVYNGYVQTIRQLGGTAGVSYSSVEIETAALLLDSPQAMCHAARWLALKLGCDPGATAPWWVFVPAVQEERTTVPAHFRLIGPDWVRVFTEETGFNAEYLFGDPRPILRQTRSDAGVEAYEVHPGTRPRFREFWGWGLLRLSLLPAQ